MTDQLRLEQISFGNNGDGIVNSVNTTIEASTAQNLGVNAKDDAIASENDILSVGNLLADNGNGIDFANGSIHITQVNGSSVSEVTIVALASGALVTVASNGQFIYNPNSQFGSLDVGANATDRFTYSITDENGATDTAIANVTIKGAVVPISSEALVRQTLYDSNIDGIPESVATTTYNAAGNQISQFSDSNGDGTPEQIQTTTYDAAGNITRSSSDTNGDGIPENVFAYTYDAAGNRTSESYSSNDGSPSGTVTYTYDAFGNATSRSADLNGDGNSDSFYTYTSTYDAAGNRTSISSDNNGDGIANSLDIYTFDAAGNQTSYSVDFENDGIIDSINTDTYDAAGNLTSHSIDYDGDGKPNNITLSTYDEAGNRTGQSNDSNGDGVAEFANVYTYNTVGDLINKSDYKIINGDSSLSRITTYSYDEEGNQLSQSTDNSADGTPDEIISYTYDEEGNRTSVSFDNNGDGVIDSMSTTLYASVAQPLAVDAKDDAIASENDILSTGNLFANNGSGADGDLQDGFIRVTQVNGVAVSAVTRITLLSGAVVTVAPNGQFVYDPNGKFDLLAPGATATDSFTYGITDINGATDSATANVTIKGAVIPTGSGSFPRQVVTDVNGDGLPDSIKTNTYDNAGNLIGESEDSNGDGRIDSISAYAYNAEGYEISSARDFSRNGQFDYFTTSTYTFDEQNNLTREISVDSYGTGIVDRIYAYTFNTNGQEIRETIDYGANGSLENITTTTYDTAGNRTEFYDANGDGIVNQVTTYNAAGYEISSARDFSIDLNRELDYFTTSTYTWDEQGNLTREISVDSFGTGVVDTIFTYTFDTSGQQIQATVDYGADGILEVVNPENSDSLIGSLGEDGFSRDNILTGGGNGLLAETQGLEAAMSGTDAVSPLAADGLVRSFGGIGVSDVTFAGNDIMGSQNEVLSPPTGFDTNLL